MAGNTFGTLFKVVTFGESHGTALGAVIDGCPSGIAVDRDEIQAALDRRKPGTKTGGGLNAAVTTRSEADTVEILSGIMNGISEGTPVALVIRNTAQHSKDYSNLEHSFRPGHADYTYFEKYGVRDYRGGGRSSGRETAARVAAGAVAGMVLRTAGIKVTAYTVAAAGISCRKKDMDAVEHNALRACDSEAAAEMEKRVQELRSQGNSAGGIVECTVTGVPAGLGEPVFDKLDAELAKAVMSIGAVKGIEFGSGFDAASSTGKDNNDAIRSVNGKPVFLSNNAGGILGGISNGADIVFRAAVKPVPSIFQKQQTISFNGTGFEDSELVVEGRHDVCLCPRIVPVIEAMAQLVLADMMLRCRSSRID
ncbi:MAG TPA: chorismate synthase [Treponema sp.]|nr:chorismate synthase [Treponema sp.]